MLQQMPSAEILERAGDFLTTGLLAANTAALQSLSVESYRALAAGEPVTESALAGRTGLSETEVAALLGAHSASAVDRDDAGALVAFNGLSLAPTAHRFEIEDQVLFTWCVFDALFLPELLGKAGTLRTRCPVTEESIVIQIAIDRLAHVSPEAVVMSMVAPDREACCGDLRGAFCNRVSFFADAEAFARATAGLADVIALNAEEAMGLALRRNRLRYPDLELAAIAEAS